MKGIPLSKTTNQLIPMKDGIIVCHNGMEISAMTVRLFHQRYETCLPEQAFVWHKMPDRPVVTIGVKRISVDDYMKNTKQVDGYNNDKDFTNYFPYIETIDNKQLHETKPIEWKRRVHWIMNHEFNYIHNTIDRKLWSYGRGTEIIQF